MPADKKGLSGSHGRQELDKSPEDPIKAQAAKIFKTKWDQAKMNPDYLYQKEQFKQKYD